MSTFLEEVRETLYPSQDAKDGPLPPLLVLMTIVTGLVDAFSYLALGHVFVANMTGNVVFLAFAFAGAKGFSIPSSILAIATFLAGSVGAGRVTVLESHRGQQLAKAAIFQAIMLALAAILSIFAGSPIPVYWSYVLIIVIGFSMGVQNATVRKLAVPDLTTTVLTLTMVGIGADSKIAGGDGSKAGRRLTSILAMFLGALIGALTILYSAVVYPLIIAAILVAIVGALARIFSQRATPWDQAKWQSTVAK